MDIIAATFLAGIIALVFYGVYFFLSAPLWLFLDKFQKKYKIPEWKITTFVGYPLFLFTFWLFLVAFIKLADFFGIS